LRSPPRSSPVPYTTLFRSLGALVACSLALRALLREGPASAYHALRQSLGRAILLGLELLVAADIIRTVSSSPTLDDVLVLALIVDRKSTRLNSSHVKISYA